MRHLLPTIVTFATLAGSAGRADDPKDDATDRTQVIRFLKKHVIDRTVSTPKTSFKLHDNAMEAEYADLTSYGNFAETATGFRFDVTTVSTEARYELDRAGKRVGPGRDLSGTEVYRYEFSQRASTKKITGIARLITRTTKGANHEATAILLTGVKVADSKLVWNETLPGYTDLIGNRGMYKAGSWDAKNTFAIVDGKLLTEYDTKRYDVDPDTLKRTPTADKVPVFVSKEVEGK